MDRPFRLARFLIRVSGPEGRSFLNNVLTQSVENSAAEPLYAALLSPQGKLQADMMLWPDDDGLIIDADPAFGPDLMRRLMMYKLRADATLEDVSEALAVAFSPERFDGAHPDPRLPRLGWRKLISSEAAAGLEDGAEIYDALRLRLGVPDLARDCEPEQVFALEALLEELNGVDFHKGCFVGQENVSRMKRRATTRKKFCPVVFEGDAPAFETPIRAGEAELGTIRSGAVGRAIALIRLDRAVEAIEQNRTLTAAGREMRLDPPDWLILPQRKAGQD